MKPFIRPDRKATKPHSSPFVWVREYDAVKDWTRYTMYRTKEDGKVYGIVVCIYGILGNRALVAHRLREARQQLKYIGWVLPTPWKSEYENT